MISAAEGKDGYETNSVEGEAFIENGYLVVVEQDSEAENPREESMNAFKILSFNGGYSDAAASEAELLDDIEAGWDEEKYGDFPLFSLKRTDPDVIRDCAAKAGSFVYPLYETNRGYATSNSADPYGERWSDGAQGVVYATERDAASFFGRHPDLKSMHDALEGELEAFSDWNVGEVYVCRVYAPGDFKEDEDFAGFYYLKEGAEPIDSCAGLSGQRGVETFIGEACAESCVPHP